MPWGASLAGALLWQLVWRAIAFLRTFVQGESRSQVYLDYAEPPPKVHLYERLCKARAEAKFTWIMPSRRQFSCKRVQSRTCSGYAERSRKCQEKVHLYETFAHVPLYAIFPPKNPSYPSLIPYLLVYKCVASV